MADPGVWGEFARDPRRPEHAHLRAADVDREVIHGVLGEAFGEGRLDREEFEERTDGVAAAKTLGELPAFVEDLIPTTSVVSPVARRRALEERALAKYHSERRQAVWGMLSISLLCWFIWFVTSFDGGMMGGFDPTFPWPVFPTAALALHAGRTFVMRQDIIDAERRRLERKSAKEPPPS